MKREKLSKQEIKDALDLLNSIIVMEGLNKYVNAENKLNKLEKNKTNASNN